MRRAVKDPADSPPLHPQALRPAVLLRFPWPRPSQTPGPINQHSPCHHRRKASCASGCRDWFPSHKGTFGSWRPTLLPGDQTIVLPRSSHHSRLFRGQRTESLCLCSQAGPCVASMPMAGWGEGAPWRRRSQAGPPQGCPRVQPANPGHALPPRRVLMFLICTDSLSTC